MHLVPRLLGSLVAESRPRQIRGSDMYAIAVADCTYEVGVTPFKSIGVYDLGARLGALHRLYGVALQLSVPTSALFFLSA